MKTTLVSFALLFSLAAPSWPPLPKLTRTLPGFVVACHDYANRTASLNILGSDNRTYHWGSMQTCAYFGKTVWIKVVKLGGPIAVWPRTAGVN